MINDLISVCRIPIVHIRLNKKYIQLDLYAPILLRASWTSIEMTFPWPFYLTLFCCIIWPLLVDHLSPLNTWCSSQRLRGNNLPDLFWLADLYAYFCFFYRFFSASNMINLHSKSPLSNIYNEGKQAAECHCH